MFDLRAALRDTNGLVTIPPGRFIFEAPVLLPDRPIVLRGAGMGLTELQFHGEGVDGLVANRTDFAGPVEVSDLTVTTTAERGGAAIGITYPQVGACHDPTVLLERVRIRPASGCEFHGAFAQGIRLSGCWSPTIGPVWIQGMYDDMTPDALADAHMTTAIDVGDAQEAKIHHAQIACCQTAVRVQAPAQGKGEGLHVSHSAIVHADTGVRAEGGVFGGWPVPWLHVSSTHLFTTGAGIFATGRSDIAIMGNSFCGSHLSPWTIGAYLADRCRNVRITGNSFWTTRPKQGHGLVIDASQDGVISENAIDGSVRIGIWLAPKCGQGWTMTGNSNRGIDALIDQRKP